jgi:hypothetical protein
MAQQGKQMRVGACKGFALNSVKLVYWLMVTGVRLISVRFFKWQIPLSIKDIALCQL